MNSNWAKFSHTHTAEVGCVHLASCLFWWTGPRSNTAEFVYVVPSPIGKEILRNYSRGGNEDNEGPGLME